MTLEELVKSLVSKYPDDPSSPSIVLSYLEDRQRWYASAVRYTERYGEGRVVVARATEESLEAALGLLASELERIWALQQSQLQLAFTVKDLGNWTGSLPTAGDSILLNGSSVRVLYVSEEKLVLKVRRVESEQCIGAVQSDA